jgi:hypothetical protein
MHDLVELKTHQYCHVMEWLYMGFGLVIRFIGLFDTARDNTLRFTVTRPIYYIFDELLTNTHAIKHFVLAASLGLHQRICLGKLKLYSWSLYKVQKNMGDTVECAMKFLQAKKWIRSPKRMCTGSFYTMCFYWSENALNGTVFQHNRHNPYTWKAKTDLPLW